jgi:hypothetical protein
MMAEVQMRQSDMSLALETALAWLAVFGIHLSRAPTDAECDEAGKSLRPVLGMSRKAIFASLRELITPRQKPSST